MLETLETAIPFLRQYSYLGVFGLILVFSFVIPLSKTLVLVAAGILASQGGGSFMGFTAISIAGFVIVDSVYFFLGYFMRERVFRLRVFSSDTRQKRIKKAEALFREREITTVFIARFLPYVRGPIFLVAGLNRMMPAKFIVIDAASSTLFVPLFVYLGYVMGENREKLLQYVDEGELILAIVAIVMVLLLLFGLKSKKSS